jgi:UDP-glucose 4-epimerase
MEQKTILITGGTGYIGSHAIVAFEQLGYRTIIIDNLVNSSKETLLWIEAILGYMPVFYEMSIGDEKRLSEIFEKYQFDGVIHFAWLKSVWESCSNPFYYHDNNISWSITLFSVMEKYGVKNIVFSSSATVYSDQNIAPFKEDDVIWSANPYGTTKVVLEYLLADYAKFAYWKAISLRYFNPIWAHISWEIGENPQDIPANILPYIFKVVTQKLPQVQIFWNDYPTKDGTWVRDYVDINDLIDSHIVAYQKLSSEENWLYKNINIGTGLGTSVLELIQEVEKVTETRIPFVYTPRRPWDIAVAYANVDLAWEYLDWRAQRSLQDSLTTAWKYIEKNKHPL